ncbi:MAG: hypothetical protein A2V99_11435 [Spirochaetes bacterium RBG_16_67_19]|nr:MAG: hypothetical protein A2V99_11435 [Spirochaetes bacterium RBG_16_67_19]
MNAKKVLELNGDFRNSPLLDTARRLHACFTRHGIPYTIIGGLAVVRNGAVRTTVDVDVLLQMGDRQRTEAALGEDFTARVDGARDRRNQVEVDFLYSGDDRGMIVPSEFDTALEANFMDLRGILELKTAVYLHKKKEDGIELAAKDLADVVALVRANRDRVGAQLLGSPNPAIRKQLRRILRRVKPGR